MTDLTELAKELKRLATGRTEWRVQHPVEKCYCMSFGSSDSINPEREAREWLADFQSRYPQHEHAKYEVAEVRCFTDLERAAINAAELLDGAFADRIRAEEREQPKQLGSAFHVSRVGVSSQFGGDTYTIKAHFHTRDHAEVARRLLEAQPLPPGPFPQQAADQAELIDLDKLHTALVWYGYAPPCTKEMLGWWVGREVNRLLDAVLAGKAERQAAAIRSTNEGTT